MDHTLIRYNTKNFESLVYRFTIEKLIEKKNYPSLLNQLEFNFQDAVRGLVVDCQHGNILKLSRFGAIRTSYHGTKIIQFKEQNQLYRSIYVDLNDPNYIAIDTSFSMAFCALYAQLVDIKDKHSLHLPSYATIAEDVLSSVDAVHADGHMKTYISQHLDDYVIRDQALVEGLNRYLVHGKKIFIVTNSDYNYTKVLLDYALNPFLDEGQTWQSLFEYTITLASKPRFFYDNLKFLSIDETSGCMTNMRGKITPGIYQGGNANKFTDDLGLQVDEVLYIGDHIYGDILRLKKDCNWRTALVVEELGQEITAQQAAWPIEQEIINTMRLKKEAEDAYNRLMTSHIEIKNSLKKQAEDLVVGKNKEHVLAREGLQKKITDLDQTLSGLLEKQNQFYPTKWDRIFRAGVEESYFAYQVERYACIYMEKLSDLFDLSPLTYFRPNRRLLAHDFNSDGNI